MNLQAKSLRLAFAFPILILLLGCPERVTTPPDQLIGTWRTSAPKYADRFFEIREDQIVFGTGADGASTHQIARISTHPIARIKEDLEGPYTFYSIYYLNEEGQEYQFAFFYNPESGGSIRFKNQIAIEWKRSKP